MMFNAVAVKDKKALSIQLTTKVEFKSLVSFILRSALELCVRFHVYIFFFSKLADHCSKFVIMSQIPLAGTLPDDLLFFRFFLVTFEKIFGTVRMICRTISLPFWILMTNCCSKP